MFSKIRNAVLALAAVAALGAATLATTTSADARGFGGGGGGFSKGGGGGMRGGSIGIRHVGGGRSFGGMRHIGGGKIGGGKHVQHRHRHHHHWCRHFGRCHYHVRWHRPLIYGVGTVAATTYAAAPARPCTCLTKEYTPDNLVVFKDVCTKEVASAPIGNTQAQLPLPQPQDQAPAPR
jgi:hypothetical protein